MSKVWLVSDSHFHHINIIKYCNRPFQDIQEMNEGLIQNWNAVVAPDDLVYHLGDVAMGGKKKAEETAEILNRLHGRIHLIKGNHDGYVLHEPCRSRFEWVRDYYELEYQSPQFGQRHFIMMHFPLLTWNSAGKTNKLGQPLVIHIHGHSHGSLDALNASTTRMDVGVDSHQYAPVSPEKIIEIMNTRTYASVDHHDAKTSYY